MRLFGFIVFLFFSPVLLSAHQENDSLKDGRYYQYDDSMHLVFSGKYRSGLRNGIFKEYDNQGFLLRKSKYKNGRLRWSQLYVNGRITEVTDSKGNVRKRKNCGC